MGTIREIAVKGILDNALPEDGSMLVSARRYLRELMRLEKEVSAWLNEQELAAWRMDEDSPELPSQGHMVGEEIRAAGKNGVTRSEMRRKNPFKKIKQAVLSEILRTLQQDEVIALRKIADGGKGKGRGRIAWVAVQSTNLLTSTQRSDRMVALT